MIPYRHEQFTDFSKEETKKRYSYIFRRLSPLSKTDQIIEQTEKYGARNYHPLPIVISEAEGVWVRDPEEIAIWIC